MSLGAVEAAAQCGVPPPLLLSLSQLHSAREGTVVQPGPHTVSQGSASPDSPCLGLASGSGVGHCRMGGEGPGPPVWVPPEVGVAHIHG